MAADRRHVRRTGSVNVGIPVAGSVHVPVAGPIVEVAAVPDKFTPVPVVVAGVVPSSVKSRTTPVQKATVARLETGMAAPPPSPTVSTARFCGNTQSCCGSHNQSEQKQSFHLDILHLGK